MRNGGLERRVDVYYFPTRRKNQDVRPRRGALFAKFRAPQADFAARRPFLDDALDSHGRFDSTTLRYFSFAARWTFDR